MLTVVPVAGGSLNGRPIPRDAAIGRGVMEVVAGELVAKSTGLPALVEASPLALPPTVAEATMAEASAAEATAAEASAAEATVVETSALEAPALTAPP